MRLNVRTSDTGDEATDWDHIDGVTNVDRSGQMLRYSRSHGRGGCYDLDAIDYFHITTVDGSEGRDR